ncbi:NAD(P)H-hydrate dehydratase [candidate division KSB1 bacterium]
MKNVVTSAEMRSIDKSTIEGLGIPGPVLMERAGIAVTNTVLKFLEVYGGNRVAIFCGKGNNGGDGFVAARELFRNNVNIEVFLFASKDEIKGDARLNLDIYEKLGLEINYITDPDELKDMKIKSDIVVDALLGTGVKGKVEGILGRAIQFINDSYKPVIAVDIPSGLNADTGTFEGDCIKAEVTITMGLVKRGLILPPGKECSGEIFVADIGFPDSVIEEKNITVKILEEDDIVKYIPPRHLDVHKGDFGKIFVLAGSAGYTGAAYMACESMMKTGAGLVVLGIPESLNTIMETKLTETMTVPLPETAEKSLSLKGLEQILSRIEWADIFVLGPGISRNKETQKLILEIFKNIEKPTIIDADGLYPFKDNLDLLKNFKSELLITPHEGEFSRLFGLESEMIYHDRIEILREKRKYLNCTILLKGTTTITAVPGNEAIVNLTGNPGMASGGTGDVLTGIIAGLAAQNVSFPRSAAVGAFIHGFTGDLGAEELGELPLNATDLISYIPQILQKLNVI